jgi:flagellar basal-body rod protein FlgB
MDPTDIGLFRLAEQRLAWVDERQQLLAQNVANANTPGFQPHDLSSFGAVLRGGELAQTSPLHFGGASRAAEAALRKPVDHAPGGNGVSVESELAKVAETAGIQQLVLTLEHSYMGMFRTAIGRAG